MSPIPSSKPCAVRIHLPSLCWLRVSCRHECGGCAGHMTAEDERVLIETGCASGVCLPLSDHAMFKGATMRHLGYLRRFAEGGCKGSGGCMRRVARLREFADTNAESCWWHAREERLLYQRNGAPRTRQLFDNDWRGPYAVDSTGEIEPPPLPSSSSAESLTSWSGLQSQRRRSPLSGSSHRCWTTARARHHRRLRTATRRRSTWTRG